MDEGDILRVDIVGGKIENLTKNEAYQGEGLSENIVDILNAGGIKPLFKERFEKQDVEF